MKTITRRQLEILDFIRDFLVANKYPPTVREIGDHFAISPKAAHDHLKALGKKGFITFSSNRSRTIELTRETDDTESVRIPILGRVHAGSPVGAEELYDGSIFVPVSCLKKGKHFALHVKGESMMGAGIMDGDLAVCLQQPLAENGQIIVAMTEDGVTLKRFYKEKNRVCLQAENPRFPSIYTSDVKILGRLVSIIRQYE
jgi:repressor LexA